MDYDAMDYEQSSFNNSIYAETTPSQRVIGGTSMSEAAKKRVDKVTKKRCLIENTAESNHLDYAHCLPRSTKGTLLDRLEFAWGMERFHLNVDTRYNILRLSPKFHRAFDANEWLLLPETQIIDAYYNARHTQKVPKIRAERYKYTLIAHQNMLEIPIHRQKSPPPDPPMPPPAESFTYCPHPYHNLPTIVSRVHPRFIICNSGSKLQDDLDPWQQKGDETINRGLRRVHAIWNSWRLGVPTREFLTKTSDGGDPDIKDDNSQKTTSHRVLRSTLPKRNAAGEQDSPTPKSSKQRTLQDGGAWLDDETLHEFDRQASSQNDHKIPKNQQIREWLRGFSDSKCIADVQGKLESDRDSDDAMASGGGRLLLS